MGLIYHFVLAKIIIFDFFLDLGQLIWIIYRKSFRMKLSIDNYVLLKIIKDIDKKI